MKRIAIVVALAAALAVAAWLGTREIAPRAIAYRESMDIDFRMTKEGEDGIRIGGRTEFDYRLTRRGDIVEVAIDRMNASGTLDDGKGFEYRMDRSGIVGNQDGAWKGVRRETASAKQVAMLDQFGSTLARISVDAEGGEVERKDEVTGGPLGETHALDAVRLFHPRFPRSRDAWESPVRFPGGRSQIAEGTLRYTKRPGVDPKGLVVVDVAGDLKLSGDVGRFALRRGDWKVKGHQEYDPSIGDWASGSLKVEADSVADTPEDGAFLFRGAFTITLSRLDGGSP